MAGSCRSFGVLAQALTLAWCIQSIAVPAARAQAAAPVAQSGPRAARGGPRSFPVDPRVRVRTYHFAEANKDMPYASFVSSKVRRDRKAPLIVMLHGLGVPDTFMLRGQALDLAEQGGYILVGPRGYNIRGWYGVPLFKRPAGAPPRRPIPGLGPQPNDPPNLRELSEKDADNLVPIAISRSWVDVMKAHHMRYEFDEVPGATHGTVITVGMPKVFAFFDEHVKPSAD